MKETAMTFWFLFASGLIAVLAIAMLSEGVDKLFTAKVSGAFFVAASFWLGGPFLYLHDPEDQLVKATSMNISPIGAAPIRVHSTKEIEPARHQPDPSEVASTDPSDYPGIDFTPTCGGGGGSGSRNRLDIAELNKRLVAQTPSC